MTITAQKLSRFLSEQAPPATGRMQGPFGATDKFRGTNLDFLFLVYYEGFETLLNGDSLVKSFRFNVEDVGGLRAACSAIAEAAKNGNAGDAWEQARAVPGLLRAISTYHEDKVAAAQAQMGKSEGLLKAGWEKFEDALRRRDFDTLIDYYPHAASLIYDDCETEVPDNEGGTRSLLRARMAKKLGREVDWARTEGKAQELSLFRWLGRPETLMDYENDIAACRHEIDRNGAILAAIREVADGLEGAFSPRPETPPTPLRTPAKIVAFQGARRING